MNSAHERIELIRRYIDGTATADERQALQAALRTDATFRRQFARYANLDAALGSGRLAAAPMAEPVVSPRGQAWMNWFSWRPLTAAAAAAVLAMVVTQAVYARFAERRQVATVAAASGVGRLFSGHGSLQEELRLGAKLVAGDSIETGSCDAAADLALQGGGRLTLGSHGALRILEGDGGRTHWNLTRGSVWASPDRQGYAIQTHNAVVEARGAQFDIETFAEGTRLRVNSGTARIRSLLDDHEVEVSAGQQADIGMRRDEPPLVESQPHPVERWTCSFSPAVQPAYGKWLLGHDSPSVRLSAAPLLWPLPKRAPLLIHDAALRVRRDSPCPVVARNDSTLVFRGRTTRPQFVRFGFSTQKVRGVFAGKFETDVPAKKLGPVGTEWEVKLPLSRFRALHPQLAVSPDGLEIVDVYALTVIEDAGLELASIALTPKLQRPSAATQPTEP